MRKSRRTKKRKNILNLYNIAILGCIIVIIASIFVILEPDVSGMVASIKNATQSENKNKPKEENNSDSKNEVKVVESSGDVISEDDAKKIAKKQFKELDEKVNIDELEVLRFIKDGEIHYYITSKENNCEILERTGEVIKINHISVKE